MTMELYHTAHSTCSQKVRLTLAEKGLIRGTDWIEREIDLGKFEQLAPAYLKLNPNGVVPTLVHDGNVLIESSAILEYLDEVFPKPAMMPADAIGRAKARAWMRYIDEVPTVAVRVPSFANLFAPMRFKGKSDAEFAAHADRLPLRKQFYQRMSQNGFGKDDIDYACGQIRQSAQRVDTAVREGGPWVMGQQFTLIEPQLTPSFDRMEDMGYAGLWADLPAFKDWWARIKVRPSYEAAFYSPSRISERYKAHFKTAAQLRVERGY